MFQKDDKKRYISILGDGKFHETVSAGVEDAILREYETSDGKKGSKWEMVYSKITANITDVGFYDGDYGMNMQITVEGDEGVAVISIGTETTFGEDFMKKAPNIDFSKMITLAPYAFTDDKGRNVRGISLYQDGDKLTNYFWDGEKTANGYPEPKNREEMTKPKWKIFFLEAREFLIEFTKENVIPKINKASNTEKTQALSQEQKDIEEFDSMPTKQEPPANLKARLKSKEEIEEGINTDEVPF